MSLHAFIKIKHLALVALLLVTACTDLPVSHDTAEKPVPLVVNQSNLSKEGSDAVIQNIGGARSADSNEKLDKLANAIRTSIKSPLIFGNKVTVLVDGPQTFAHLRRTIASATQSINVETYIFSDDALGKDFASLLMERSRAGIKVRLIFDAIGSIASSSTLFDEMRAAGIQVEEFHPLLSLKKPFWHYNNRDHRKLLIVDGKVAFTGGLNISGTYSSGSSSRPGPERGLEDGWRDTDAEIEGPAVRLFQAIFFDTWASLGGQNDEDAAKYFPPWDNAGSDIVTAVASSGVKQRKEEIYSSYLAAIQNASKQVWITQAYFSPPPKLRSALIKAAQRGVDVRILVPGFTDSSVIFYAARGGYEPLLKHGVRMFEVTNALLHAKTAVIDHSVTVIGSANFDYRSFLHNNEVTAIVISEVVADRMDEIFLADLKQSKEIDPGAWKKRPAGEKFKEWVSRLFNYWL